MNEREIFVKRDEPEGDIREERRMRERDPRTEGRRNKFSEEGKRIRRGKIREYQKREDY